MLRRFPICIFSVLLAGSATVAFAQPGPPGGPGGGPGRFGQGGPGPAGPGGDMMRMLPVMAALDADSNGETSAEEIEKSVAALKGLDKNKDGKLTMDELRPEFMGRGPDREGRGGPGFGGGPRDGGDAGRPNDERRDEDGRGDEGRREGPREGAPREGGPGREGGPRDGAPREGGPGGRGPGGFGFGNPEQFIERAFEFDADKDEKLSKDELRKMLAELGPPPFRRGDEEGRGEGGRGEAGRGERERGPERGGDRPRRPE